jgi:hypothetical protein
MIHSLADAEKAVADVLCPLGQANTVILNGYKNGPLNLLESHIRSGCSRVLGHIDQQLPQAAK